MKTIEFKKGTRVVVNGKEDPINFINAYGTVLESKWSFVSIEFDKPMAYMHSCTGLGKYGYCYNIYYDKVRVANKEEKEKKKDYKVLKSFSLNDLYDMKVPNEVFKLYFNSGFGFDDGTLFEKGEVITCKNEDYYKLIDFHWFQNNGLVEIIEPDIKLNRGMRLLNKVGIEYMVCCISKGDYRLIDIDSGNRWNQLNWYGKTLKDLNDCCKGYSLYRLKED